MSYDRACHSKLEPLLGENHHLSPCERAFVTEQNPMKMDGALELWETGGFHASWAALEAAEYDLVSPTTVNAPSPRRQRA